MKKVLLSSFLLGSLVCVGVLGWLYADMRAQLTSPMTIVGPEKLTIEPGMSLKTLSYLLVDKGWLSHPYYLIFEGRLRGSANLIKAGEYAIETNTTPEELLKILVSGKVIQYSLTLVEGWNFKQVMEAVRNNKHLLQTLNDFEPDTVMTAIGHPSSFPEGMFFPDTYYFPKGTSDVEFLQRAYQTMEAILKAEWDTRKMELIYQSPYEVLIMASIIEKETALAEEYGKIAGVFVRRLQKRMKLQTDPTVIYALGDSYDGDIRRRDLSFDSPYNTYVYRGLPPTPIAMPGRAAIHAALNPEPGQALYFVSKGDGSHYFSTSLQEHNRAVAKYQLGR